VRDSTTPVHPDRIVGVRKTNVRTETYVASGSCPGATGFEDPGESGAWCVDEERTLVMSRDGLGRVEQMDFPNGISTSYVYVAGDLRNRVDRLTTASASSVLLDLDYDYDPASTRRITAIEDVEGARKVLASGGTLPANVVPGWSYGYDAVGRLTGAVFVGVGEVGELVQPLPAETWGYAYDAAGRRAAATYSGQDGVRNDAYSWNGLGRLVAAGADRSLQYDGAGRVSQLTDETGTHDLEYDARGQLSRLVSTKPQEGGGSEVNEYQFAYGADHRLAKFTNPTGDVTLFFWGGRATYEFSAAGELLRATVWDTDGFTPLVSVQVVDGVESFYYFHNDHLATPKVVTNDDGNAVWSSRYDPFGFAHEDADVDGDGVAFDQPLRFPGQWDLAGGTVFYNWNRFYFPAFGVFATLDPDQWGLGRQGAGTEFYDYVSDPNASVDPAGRFFAPWHGVITFLGALGAGNGLEDAYGLAMDSVFADYNSQGTSQRDVHTHAMRVPGESHKDYENGVRDTKELWKNFGFLGRACHAVQDGEMFMHRGRYWSGGFDRSLDSVVHILDDLFPNPVTVIRALNDTEEYLAGSPIEAQVFKYFMSHMFVTGL